MKFFKYFIIFLLCSCSLHFKETKKYEQNLINIVANEAFEKKYKSIILFETNNNLVGSGLVPRNILKFVSNNGSEFLIDLYGKNYSTNTTNTHSYTYITPGEYKLISAEVYDRKTFGNRVVWIDESYDNIDASFVVNPGEIVYLGKLIFNVTGNNRDNKLFGHKNNLIYNVKVISELNDKDKKAIEKLFNRSITTRLINVHHE